MRPGRCSGIGRVDCRVSLFGMPADVAADALPA